MAKTGDRRNGALPTLKTKRVYEPAAAEDGHRILVDRVWPRGLTKSAVRVDAWRKDLAPSEGLRKWFAHDPSKWDEFRRRYRDELRKSGKWADVQGLADRAEKENVTLVFGARDETHNQAVALKEMALGR